MIDYEKRLKVFERDHYTCCNCGKSIMYYMSPQIAHMIAKSKNNIKKYSKEVIDHELNLKSTCSLRCNDACMINIKGKIEIELVNKIKKELNNE